MKRRTPYALIYWPNWLRWSLGPVAFAGVLLPLAICGFIWDLVKAAIQFVDDEIIHSEWWGLVGGMVYIIVFGDKK